MKKLILLTFAVCAFSMAFSQTNEKAAKKVAESKEQQKALLQKEKKADRKELTKMTGNEVNPLSKRQFTADFGNIPTVKWKRGTYMDEASFSKDGKALTAFYDNDGKLVGTTSIRPFTELPANAQKFIKEKYKDYKIVEVLFYDDNEANDNDMFLYEKQFDDEDTYFAVVEKDNKKTVLQIDRAGYVYFFTNIG